MDLGGRCPAIPGFCVDAWPFRVSAWTHGYAGTAWTQQDVQSARSTRAGRCEIKNVFGVKV